MIGLVRVKALIGDVERRRVKEVVFLAYTGAYFPITPLDLAKELGIEVLTSVELTLTDRSKVEAYPPSPILC